MTSYLSDVIVDVLTMIYQYLGISLVCGFLLFMLIKEAKGKQPKELIISFFKKIKSDRKELFTFILFVYVFMVAQKTIFNRIPWGNPLQNVIGDWGLYTKDGLINYNMFENFFMFILLIPLIKLSDYNFGKIKAKRIGILESIGISLMASFCIEMIQLLFRLGAFQLSDIAMNTAGGLAGFLLFFMVSLIWKGVGKK